MYLSLIVQPTEEHPKTGFFRLKKLQLKKEKVLLMKNESKWSKLSQRRLYFERRSEQLSN
jgi:hypothetical protein